jgi:hypothetical protein
LIWIQYAKVIKKREKQKLENESEQKKEEERKRPAHLGRSGAQNQPEQASARNPLFSLFLFLFFSSELTGGTALSDPPSSPHYLLHWKPPALLPAHSAHLLAIKTRRYKKPRSSSPSSLCFQTDCAARLSEFFAEDPRYWRRKPSIPMSLQHSEPSLWSILLPQVPAHLLIFTVPSVLQ